MTDITVVPEAVRMFCEAYLHQDFSIVHGGIVEAARAFAEESTQIQHQEVENFFRTLEGSSLNATSIQRIFDRAGAQIIASDTNILIAMILEGLNYKQ